MKTLDILILEAFSMSETTSALRGAITGTLTATQICNRIAEATGHAPNRSSVSVYLSRLVEQVKLVRVARGRFALPGLVTARSATLHEWVARTVFSFPESWFMPQTLLKLRLKDVGPVSSADQTQLLQITDEFLQQGVFVGSASMFKAGEHMTPGSEFPNVADEILS